MDIDRMRENDFYKEFSPVFIFHVRRTFRENFVLLCGMARSLSSITTLVKKSSKNKVWGCSNIKMTKKNIISRRFTPSGRLFEWSAFSEISGNRRSCEKIVVVRRVDLFIKGFSSQKSQYYSYLAESFPSGAWSTRYIAQRELHHFQKSTWSHLFII